MPSASARDPHARLRVGGIFESLGWSVQRTSGSGPDLVIRKGSQHYAVELKHIGEGRSDRVIALMAQAILQARRHAFVLGLQPLAMLHVGRTSPALLRNLEAFHHEYAADTPIGLVSEAGEVHLFGPGFESFDNPARQRAARGRVAKPRKASDLFSDLNQWMLKVLLAPELPERMLTAPRGEYGSGAEFAAAADVSPMSASRFIHRLQEDGFLDNSGGALRLVRRAELFRRWQSAALRSSPELRMTYLVPGTVAGQLQKVAAGLDACIGLFAAADLLNVGHVSGALPVLYVRHLRTFQASEWRGLAMARIGEPPHLVIRQAPAAQSVFRAAVRMDGIMVSDVLQIWLDVSAHPSRGVEQADVLRRKVLSGVIGG